MLITLEVLILRLPDTNASGMKAVRVLTNCIYLKKAKQTGTRESGKGRKKVFIVEDHPVFREGLIQVIRRESDLEVCGHANNAQTALKDILSSNPDVALVDISLPGKNGLELIKDLRKRGTTLKILVVSMHDEALYANRALRAGGDGYIMKQEDPQEVVHAIRDVLAGHTYLSEAVLNAKASHTSAKESVKGGSQLDALTDRQLCVLELLGTGKDAAAIASQTSRAPEAIAEELADIRSRLKLGTDTELTRYAVCWVESGRT